MNAKLPTLEPKFILLPIPPNTTLPSQRMMANMSLIQDPGQAACPDQVPPIYMPKCYQPSTSNYPGPAGQISDPQQRSMMHHLPGPPPVFQQPGSQSLNSSEGLFDIPPPRHYQEIVLKSATASGHDVRAIVLPSELDYVAFTRTNWPEVERRQAQGWAAATGHGAAYNSTGQSSESYPAPPISCTLQKRKGDAVQTNMNNSPVRGKGTRNARKPFSTK
jgi:hypothetical protein